jgi:hypothetical protein
MEEKRKFPRVPYLAEVECYNVAGASPLNPRISDLSITGAFIDSVMVLPVGTMMSMKFSLPSLLMEVTVEVVQSMPNFGMGVRFVGLTPAQKAALEEVVSASPS